MLETPNREGNDDSKQQPLSVSLHPDDAKDKVFTGILKALLKMNNKPSSPKELATVIMQCDFATLGGSTPFATVSSRISQHFKRAAQHKPPRSPLLARHVDSSHSRKINYSLAMDPIRPLPVLSKKNRPQQKLVQLLYLENDDATTKQKKTTGRRTQKHDALYIYGNEKMPKPKRSASPIEPTTSPVPSSINAVNVTRDLPEDNTDCHQGMLIETLDTFDATSETINSKPLLPLAIPRQLSDSSTSESTLDYSLVDGTNTQWINNLTAEDNFGLVRLPDSSTAHHLPFTIDAPESIPISELDDYFGNDNDSTVATYSSSTRNNTHIFKTSSPQLTKTDDTHSTVEDANAHNINYRESDKQSLRLQHCNSRSHQATSLDYERNCATITTYKHNWNKNNDTHNIDPSQHSISKQVTEQECDDNSENTNTVGNSTQHTASDSEQSIPTCIGDKCDDNIFFCFDDDSNDEDYLRNDCPSVYPVHDTQPVASSLNVSTLTKLLELMHDNQADFATLHRIITTDTDLNYLSPIVAQIKSLAAYIHTTTTRNDTDVCSFSVPPTTDSNSTDAQQDADVNTIFTQFPVLKPLFGKHNVQQNISSKRQSTLQHTTMVKTIASTNPTMYITVIDDIAVCVATLPSTSNTPEYRIMRRLDMDYVNGTTLLKAGGIDTESERSVIFSLEKDRLRIRQRSSSLNGTWLPLKRALHLAATCSIQHRLGSFLDNNIESHFPSPLPVNIVKRQQTKIVSPSQHLPYSWKLNNNQENSPLVLSRNLSLTGSDGAFWTDPASDTPSLPCVSSAVDSITHVKTNLNDSLQQRPSMLPRKTTSTKATSCATNDDDSSDDSTDTDSDTEEVRRQAKRDYDAAVNAKAEDASLDNLVNRKYQQNRSKNTHTHNKRRRKEILPRNNRTTDRKAPMRRRNSATTPKQTFTPGMIIRSASCTGPINLRQPLSPASATNLQPDQERSIHGVHFCSTTPGSTSLSTFDEGEVDFDIGDYDMR